jgi:predicted esterase
MALLDRSRDGREAGRPRRLQQLEEELPPIAIVHGTQDPVIPVEFAHRTRDRLAEVGANVSYSERPIGHTIHPDDVANLSAWLWREISWH